MTATRQKLGTQRGTSRNPRSSKGNDMKVTVCELRDEAEGLEQDWGTLVAEVRAEGSDLVLLPEMPFGPWVAASRKFDAAAWRACVVAHDRWMSRLAELGPAVVLGTRPVESGDRRLNEAFVWDAGQGYRPVHHKHYLPDEEGFWEASWYGRGRREFAAADTKAGRVAFLVCTEMWFTAHAIDYARAGVQFLACPRASPGSSTEKWKAGGVAGAVVSGAYCLASNRGGPGPDGREWGGTGWIIEPEEGRILDLTSRERPVVTVAVDPGVADRAKRTYPRYV